MVLYWVHFILKGVAENADKLYLICKESRTLPLKLFCGQQNENDLYTISSSNQGNKALQYPIGLITADEIILSGSSGGVFEENYSQQKINSNGYLTMGSSFWTMTPAGGYNPFGYIRWYSMVFYVNFSNNFGAAHTTNTLGLRSVINIKSDVTITGNGTKDNPYTIS